MARGAYRQSLSSSLRGFRIPALLHQNVEHFATLIDRAPQVHEFTVDLA